MSNTTVDINICKAVNNHDALVEALYKATQELYRVKMSEALNWSAGTDKAIEFAKEQTKEYTELLNQINES